MRGAFWTSFLLLACLPVRGEPDVSAPSDSGVLPLFRQGRVELQAGGGYGIFNNEDYLILLLGGAYYLRDGLSVGAAAEAWVGSQPQVYDVSPQVRYVFVGSDWRFKPYVGAFYRRTFYNHELGPLDSAGARAGLVFPLNRRAYLTGGVAYEHYFGCDRSVYASCSVAYPELGLAVGF